jgi:hypothetical protein
MTRTLASREAALGFIVATVVGCILPLVAVRAQEPETARKCASIAEDGQRLACYDGIFRSGRPDETHATPAAAVPSGSTAVDSTAVSAADFGLTEQQIRQTRPDESPEPDAITSPITQLKRAPTGELIVTLENGQVWRQTDSTSSRGLRTGDQVTVKRAAMGSFFLTVAGQPTLRVRRIK